MLMLRLIHKSASKQFSRSYKYYCSMAETARMNIPIVYGDEISPPVRFVTMTASILGIDLDFHKIDLFKNENRSESFMKINPLQKVPAMVVGDITICDSHAIATYLCQIGNDTRLYPDESLLRAKINQILFFNSSTLFRIDSEIFMHLCDICAVPVVTSMLQLVPLTERHPKVAQWTKKFEDYPFYEINKRGLEALRNCIDVMNHVYNN
ncbi:glutathione S-transferase E14-like isoform X3 [Maniola jurtina]|uniref:glutathione S-transferase E14-like isoform X3 n=1 Tax=Maniola jurtina TaxID=191418 RepID=UPI001E68F972|nr:glutathione S-transferase E14-like isoform X3 [Maniola jurtina]